MDSSIEISICIPAYKRPGNIRRLLESIAMQSFEDYEIVISDDSPDDSVQAVVERFSFLPITYYRNEKPLGTPNNWNQGMFLAKGKWIKIMHDDDWFNSEYALKMFASAVAEHPIVDFIFCAYNNVYLEDKKRTQTVRLDRWKWTRVKKNPFVLIGDNVVGPPSVVMHKNDRRFFYDTDFKWVVDMDFYIRYLDSSRTCYINQPLVNVGVHGGQVTQYTFGVASVQLKENFYLLAKSGEKNLCNLYVFDAWWRLIRNFSIRNIQQIKEAGYFGPIPKGISLIVGFQNKISIRLLNKGVFSKLFMLYVFLTKRNKFCK